MSSFNRFKHQLDSALDLLESSEKTKQLDLPQVLGAQMVDTESLLNRCDQVCEKHKQEKPTIRIIHHLACSGGAELSECISLMPNVCLLSEVHPYFKIDCFKPSLNLTDSVNQTDLIYLKTLNEKLFVQNVKIIAEEVIKSGRELVIRDNAFFDYLSDSKIHHRTIVRLLEQDFNVVSVVLFRDVIDTYASLKYHNFLDKKALRFDDFCQRVHEFLGDYSQAKLIKYEDLSGNTESTLKDVCSHLSLTYNENFGLMISRENKSQFDCWQPTQEDCYNTMLTTKPSLNEIGESEHYFNIQNLTKDKNKKIILIATMPRSGSTWLFNCVREILKSQDEEFYSCWIEDYIPSQSSKVHVVKAHEPEYRLSSQADVVISTRRDVRNICVSLARMGWLQKKPEAMYILINRLINFVHPFWYIRSSLEIEYEDILENAFIVVDKVVKELGFSNKQVQVKEIVSYLDGLKAPEKYDRETQLHPQHRANRVTDFTHSLEDDFIEKINHKFKRWFDEFGY